MYKKKHQSNRNLSNIILNRWSKRSGPAFFLSTQVSKQIGSTYPQTFKLLSSPRSLKEPFSRMTTIVHWLQIGVFRLCHVCTSGWRELWVRHIILSYNSSWTFLQSRGRRYKRCMHAPACLLLLLHLMIMAKVLSFSTLQTPTLLWLRSPWQHVCLRNYILYSVEYTDTVYAVYIPGTFVSVSEVHTVLVSSVCTFTECDGWTFDPLAGLEAFVCAMYGKPSIAGVSQGAPFYSQWRN